MYNNLKNLKILFIQPSQFNDDGSLRKSKRAWLPRLALPQLASITPDEVKTYIIDEYIDDIDFNADVDFVCISATTVQAPRAYQISEEFRKRGKTTIIGGMHASLLPDEAQNYADSIFIGEAEGLWTEVLHDFNQGNLKPRYQNLANKLDITHIPSPNLTKLSLDRYEVVFRPVQTTRGCPHNCDYCSVTKFFGKSYRYRSIDDIVREIEQLDSKFVFFVDDNIAANPQRAKKLFKAITPLNIKWTSQCCMSIAYNDELLESARESGCVNLMLGLESLSAQSLQTVNKSINKVNDYFYIIDKIHNYGITVMAFMIFGFDYDDETVFDKTIKFVDNVKIDFPCYWILTPYPNTPLYEKLESEHRIIERDWSKYDCTHVVFNPKLMTPEVLEQGYHYACKKAYSLSNMVKRFIVPSSFNLAKNLLETMPQLITQLKLFRQGIFKGYHPMTGC
ncbi:MAG: radical SAM protein [bacterium]